MALTKYNKKRSFTKTPEPRGIVKKKTKNVNALPMFIVQKHDASRLHYDFRLEIDGVLKSWAVPKGPSLDPNEKRLAIMTEDHPLSYATFEGTIPKGEYGGGEVIVWDKGVYTSAETKDPNESRKKIKEGLRKGDLKIVLYGEKLKGAFALVKLKTGEPNAWLLIKKKDEYATTHDVTSNVGSVLSDAVLTRDAEVTAPKRKNTKAPHQVQGKKACRTM